MAQVSSCPPLSVAPAKEWLDTGARPIGTFRFRGGEAPTTRALLHETAEGRRFIPARPAGFPAPPWQAEARFIWQLDLAWSIRRALRGQTPRRLILFLVALNLGARVATLHPVFSQRPTREDEDRSFAVELEVSADFAGYCELRTQMLLAPPSNRLHLPAGMVAYRRPR